MIFVLIALAIVSFAVGAVVGVNNASTVNTAIATLKEAEQKALGTLEQITAHKNS
jgi:hypothetical protein